MFALLNLPAGLWILRGTLVMWASQVHLAAGLTIYSGTRYLSVYLSIRSLNCLSARDFPWTVWLTICPWRL